MRSLADRFWVKVNKSGTIPAGHPELGPCWVWTAAKTAGYGVIGIGKKNILAHRVSWEIVFGPIPEGMELDHICLNRACVNPGHLRVASHAVNARNTMKRSSNRSGFKGVSWHAGAKKWRALIVLNKKQIHLGFFHDPVAAHGAYCDAAQKLYGEFANSGN